MLFWLRFFGAKRSTRTSKNYDSSLATEGGLVVPASGGPSKPRKSIAYVPVEPYSDGELAPLDGSIAFVRRKSHRRSAIDLARSKPSVELGTGGPGVRISVDSIPSGRHYLGSLLNSYTNFVTTHRGKHAKIVRSTNRFTGDPVVLKVFDKATLSATQREDILKEMQILRTGKGYGGIVQFEGTYEDEYFLSIVLGDCPGGTLITRLHDHGGRMSEGACVRDVVKPLVSNIAWLHAHGIVHRDLKPEHILFDATGGIRLVDFISAGIVGKDSLNSREGTLAYMAPEVLVKPTPDEIFHEVICNGMSESDLPTYDEKIDIWSLGVIIIEALTGRQPFLADSPEGMARVQQMELLGNGYGSVLDMVRDREFLSVEGQDFLSSVMRINADDRPSAEELLTHPWMDYDSNECADVIIW